MKTLPTIQWLQAEQIKLGPGLGRTEIVPDIAGILTNIESELARLLPAGNADKELKRELAMLGNSLKAARDMLEHSASHQIAFAFFTLGLNVGAMQNELRGIDNHIEALRLEIADIKRKEPLKLKEMAARRLRESVQQRARSKWLLSENENVRVAEMAEIIWAESCEAFMHMSENSGALSDVIPDRAIAIIPWLREVAPAFAKKPGRPKKI